jgi:hypothetical protein
MPKAQDAKTSARSPEHLKQKLAVVIKKKRKLDLAKLGYSACDLTEDILLSGFEHYYSGLTILEVLTTKGYLAQIPPECLTPEVVLAEGVPYTSPSNQCTEKIVFWSFLNFCAETGHYLELPPDYHTATYLVGTEPEEISACPFLVAACAGKLDLLPISVLRPEDITRGRLRDICFAKQTERIQHLLSQDHVTTDFLAESCAFGMFPVELLPFITAEKMLMNSRSLLFRGGTGSLEDYSSPLWICAQERILDDLPLALFINHFKEVHRQIRDFIDSASERGRVPKSGFRRGNVRRANEWLLKLVDAIFRAGAAKHGKRSE